ncbi:MAG TPA: polyprenyl synthetase family protein [Anaerolineales bacterium]|nr:polyprenyl synthetase family protein [Anaerolineales bacterium]HND47478.1 polyprenyl synthetase family protein [Anaerolineales bacterium]HNE04404.1 polyprenyl synthetase family protein [Anaerolineales bacterium]HNH26190.1 polyprenyl synthetase family protein [Anaerolineales bacterium]
MNSVTFLSPVTEEIKLIEDRMRIQADDSHPDLRAALKHLLAAGGKRIRPTLGMLVGNMLGAPLEKLINLGAAVELLHTATLVHDDLIDGSLLRRGTPTLNARWSPPATVLTGDFLFARAAKLAADTDYLPLMKLFSETLAIIVNGELTQMFTSRGLINRDNYYKRIYAKTASLFEMTSRSAAMVSPASDDSIEAMRDFGYQIGMAFQIVDDILDFNGDQNAVGKPLGSDLLNGLVTLPAIYFAEINPDDPDVMSLPQGGWTNNENMTRLVEKIRASSCTKKAMVEAEQHVDRALVCLESFEPCAERDALENLAKYIVDRKV